MPAATSHKTTIRKTFLPTAILLCIKPNSKQTTLLILMTLVMYPSVLYPMAIKSIGLYPMKLSLELIFVKLLD